MTPRLVSKTRRLPTLGASGYQCLLFRFAAKCTILIRPVRSNCHVICSIKMYTPREPEVNRLLYSTTVGVHFSEHFLYTNTWSCWKLTYPGIVKVSNASGFLLITATRP